MPKHRLESFSDGVFAIVITLLILNVHLDRDQELTWLTLANLGPDVLAFALTFVIVGVYWVSHHSMMHMIKQWIAGCCGSTSCCCSPRYSYRFPHTCLSVTCARLRVTLEPSAVATTTTSAAIGVKSRRASLIGLPHEVASSVADTTTDIISRPAR